MFFGIILLCTAGTTDISGKNCVLFNSPTTFDTEEMCIASIGNVLMSEAMELNIASGLELRNAKCFDVRPDHMANSM